MKLRECIHTKNYHNHVEHETFYGQRKMFQKVTPQMFKPYFNNGKHL